ncbi:MAG: hypothetical protein QM750_00185 [Rubrivivax sp.]
MAGKKRTPVAPAWFSPDSYRLAAGLDMGDWLLNLTLRSWLHHKPNERTELALRSVGPVLRRKDEAQIKGMHLADVHRWVARFKANQWDDMGAAFDEACSRPSLPLDVWEALQTGRVRSGIEPLDVTSLYAFERMLPAAIRAAGASFKATDSLGRYPKAFSGRLDDAFQPQMVGRFVRVDLARPDDVLLADLRHYLAAERQRLAVMGGEQPYREAAHLKLKASDLRSLAVLGLLEFLDLDRWQRASGQQLSFYAIREMANVVDRARESELRRRVGLTLNQMQLHAWFARLDRRSQTPRRNGRFAQ